MAFNKSQLLASEGELILCVIQASVCMPKKKVPVCKFFVVGGAGLIFSFIYFSLSGGHAVLESHMDCFISTTQNKTSIR